MVFTWFFRSTFFICSMILCMPILTIFFLGFLTWGSPNHFIIIKYMTRTPIGRSVVCYLSPPCFLHYSNNPPYLCFPFVGKWYAYNRSHIKCSYLFLQLQQEFFALGLSMQLIKFGFHRGYTILYHFLLTFLFLTWVFIFWAH
jgi:hypothetical protein